VQPPITIGVRRPDKGVSWAVFTAVPIKDDDGTTTGAVVTFIDITLRKKLEHDLRVAQKMEGIGRLAGGIAHDFNNLLTVIVINAQSLQGTFEYGDPRHEDADHVLHAARHATSLTRQLLAFARRQEIVPEVLALDQLVLETTTMLRRTLGEHIEVVFDSVAELWPVRVDRGQFEQVLLNLAVNAADVMPSGGRLTIRLGNCEDNTVSLCVTDTGPGIDEAIVDRNLSRSSPPSAPARARDSASRRATA
jgi:signal transduction histidine kinase